VPSVSQSAPKFFIDECLSPILAANLRGRGFHAEHVNDVKAKRKKKRMTDPQVATYALERDLIVATRNIVDFEQIYIARNLHPGLILFDCPEEENFTIEVQQAMLDVAVDEIVKNEPLQEAIRITLAATSTDDFDFDVTRHELPIH
jgi:predicted nuclease of predicted toxin-antitoxin system